jgi:Protein of unknown function (DUF4236)
MGFRFRRRIKIIPGLWLNVSKRGMSTSVGGKGLTVNLKGDRVKTTASLPGSGLSYSETTRTHHEAQQASASDPAPSRHVPVWVWLLIAVVVLLLIAH